MLCNKRSLKSVRLTVLVALMAGVTAEPVQQLFGLDHALIANSAGSKYENNAKLPFLEAGR